MTVDPVNLPTIDRSELIRDVVSELTIRQGKAKGRLRPRIDYECPHCKGLYDCVEIRYHVPRCESKPRRSGKTQTERVLGARRISVWERVEARNRAEYLNTGSQGAD